MKIFIKVISLFLLPLFAAGQQENANIEYLYKSLSNATDDTARMEACSKLGSYYSLEDRDSSNFYLEEALSIAARLHLKYDEASILNAMGVILMQQEKFSKSLEFYLKALNIAKDPSIERTIWKLPTGNNPMTARMLLLSNCYDLIGLLNAYTGSWTVNTKNQLKNYREAEKYAKAAGDSRQIAYVNFHMGIAYMNDEKLDSAFILFRESISTFSTLKDQSGLGRVMKYLGDAYRETGNFDLAADTILNAIAILRETNDYLHLGLGYISLSRVFADLKKNDSALYYAREGLKIFEKRKDPAWKRDAYNLIISCFDQLDMTDSATVYLKLAKSLNDSLSIEERKNLLAFLDVVVEEQVKLEKLEKEKIETREKLRVYLLLSGIAVFMVIVFLLYRNNQHRKKTNETLKQRNEKIESTLHQLRSTQTQLIQSEKMASLGELTAGIAHEIQNPLNFVNNFSEVNQELLSEMTAELDTGNLEMAKSIAADVISNEEKIKYHGLKADAIVKSMLQHSRSGNSQKELTDINGLVEEYTKLAYHGMRSKEAGFNVNLISDLDPQAGLVAIVPQDIGRVLLNLINNAFYAVAEKMKTAGEGYTPEVTVSTRRIADQENPPIRQSVNSIILEVADNGNGIPNKVLDKIFQPFYTTKPTGQGTGLGLSLSYDIIKAHGGEIKVETKTVQPGDPEKSGSGTTFIISLPVNTTS